MAPAACCCSLRTTSAMEPRKWLLDEIYDLKGEFAKFKPKKLNNPEDIREVEFEHPFTGSSAKHDWIYFKKTNWLGGEISERQEGGFNMKRRVADNDKEGIDKQLIFPTKISIPALEPGDLGVELARCYNNWVRKLVTGHENRLLAGRDHARRQARGDGR